MPFGSQAERRRSRTRSPPERSALSTTISRTHMTTQEKKLPSAVQYILISFAKGEKHLLLVAD